ncbi:hypothetical protein MaudCBS49596_002678 [Microsporum audouinii]
MISLVAFDLDGTLALSKQPLLDSMGEALADLLAVAHVAVISGGDWPQFQKQADLRKRLPDVSINMGGATSIDITQKGVDKAYGLKRLCDASDIPLEQMMFIGDAIFPGGNDYPAKQLGLKTVCVKDPNGTLAAITAIIACLS